MGYCWEFIVAFGDKQGFSYLEKHYNEEKKIIAH